MKKRTGVQCCVSLSVLLLVAASNAQVVVDSFDGDGRISWQVASAPATCNVQWASSPAGPWYQSWSHLKDIVVTGVSASASVPLFFRIVRDPFGAPTNGLVAYYPLEGNGLDASGQGHNGTLVSGPVTTNGRIGQALYLHSSVGRVSVPGSSAFAFTNLSMAAWIRCNNYSNSTPSYIVTDSTSTGNQGGFEFDVTRGTLHMHYRISTNPIFFDLYSPLVFLPSDNNKWHHVAVTCEYTGAGYTIRLYKNGVLVHTATTTSPPMAYSNSDLILGTNYDVRRFDGVLDEVYLYKRVLGQDEVQALFSLAP
jgi:hypothetical protein